MACPHCGSDDIDYGQTGLDLCNKCGGLNRGGAKLDYTSTSRRCLSCGNRSPFGLPQGKPFLGTATTRELLEEIKTRGELSQQELGGGYPEERDMAIGAANLLDTLPGSILDKERWVVV